MSPCSSHTSNLTPTCPFQWLVTMNPERNMWTFFGSFSVYTAKNGFITRSLLDFAMVRFCRLHKRFDCIKSVFKKKIMTEMDTTSVICLFLNLEKKAHDERW